MTRINFDRDRISLYFMNESMTLLSQNCHTFIHKLNLCAASVRKKKQSRPQRRTTTAPAPLTPLAWLAPLRSSVFPRVSAASRGKLAGGKLAGESAETEATQTSGAELAEFAELAELAGAELAERS